jgi:hypothetical protein
MPQQGGSGPDRPTLCDEMTQPDFGSLTPFKHFLPLCHPTGRQIPFSLLKLFPALHAKIVFH